MKIKEIEGFSLGKYCLNFLVSVPNIVRFLYKGIIINHNKKLSQPTLKRRFFKKKGGVFFMARFRKGVVLT